MNHHEDFENTVSMGAITSHTAVEPNVNDAYRDERCDDDAPSEPTHLSAPMAEQIAGTPADVWLDGFNSDLIEILALANDSKDRLGTLDVLTQFIVNRHPEIHRENDLIVSTLREILTDDDLYNSWDAVDGLDTFLRSSLTALEREFGDSNSSDVYPFIAGMSHAFIMFQSKQFSDDVPSALARFIEKLREYNRK